MKKSLHNRKLITCKCDECNVDFQKAESEYKRNLSKGRKNFCSRSCCGKHNINSNIGDKRNTEHLQKGSTADDFTPFRYYLRTAQSRLKDCNLTLEGLKKIWETQNGICPYSGIHLQLSTYCKIIKDPILSASLDRIDSTEGYTLGNVQFVSRAINYMKNTMSHDDTLRMCQLITQNHSLLS